MSDLSNKDISELKEEIRRREWAEMQRKQQEEIKKLDNFEQKSKIRVYTSDDYCGMELADQSFYFGYEETMCPKHDDPEKCSDLDCELSEWAFVATVNGKEVMRLPQSELYPDDGEEPFFHLLVGIAKFMQKQRGSR